MPARTPVTLCDVLGLTVASVTDECHEHEFTFAKIFKVSLLNNFKRTKIIPKIMCLTRFYTFIKQHM